MSKKDQPSKYLSSFYSNTGQSVQPNVPGRSSNNAQVQPPASPKPPFHDVDKFKNPADFFKSSQSLSSQSLSSQVRSSQSLKRTSFGAGGSTHDLLSQSFQPKRSILNQNVTTKPSFLKPPSPIKPAFCSKPIFSKPSGSMLNNQFPAVQRISYSGLDQNAASTKALELQWTTKMRQAKKAGMEAQKLQGLGNQEKRNMGRNDTGKSPMGKSVWADVSFTKTDAACKNQQNDPWYSNDVWGDDLSVEAVDECLRVASTQEAKKSADMQVDDVMSSWMNESWASPEKFPPPKPKPGTPSVKTALFAEKKDDSKEKGDDFMALLSGDPSFMSFLDSVEQQQKTPPGSSSAGKKHPPTQAFNTQTRLPSSQVSLSRSQLLPSPTPRPSTQLRRSVPLSERLPVSTTSGNLSFVIKAKEFESPSKNEVLSLSQRKLQKPTKSLPSPTSNTSKHQTEWLRGQLEKITSQFSHLKEDVQVKEGESKLLREKLKSAEEEVQKHKLEKVKELDTLREAFEKKVKQLERQLEATQVQAIFKAKEAESSLEKYRELKTISVRAPEPSICQSFKNLPVVGSRPGESSKTLFDDVTASTNDIVDETILDLLTQPMENAITPVIEGTPEKCLFEDSPVKTPVEAKADVMNETTVFDKETQYAETPISTLIDSPKDRLFHDSFLEKNSEFVKTSHRIVHGKQPKKELNHFLMPPMEYLPHTLLQTEFSEQELENYPVRRPTLVELWGTSYDAFGDTILNDYEKANVGDAIPADPARSILSKSRYFSTLKDAHGILTTLSTKSRWGSSERVMARNIVDLATEMTRELYATLGDPRLLQTTYTIYDRDPKILKDFQNCSELSEAFDPLSPEKWKDESYVELRRCLVVVGFLCSVDHMTARYIINPKARNCGKTSEFYPPNSDSSQNNSRKSKSDKEVALKIVLKEGERKPSELKLMQMYRDLHSKNLTIVSKMVSLFMPKDYETIQTPKKSSVSANFSKNVIITDPCSSAEDALKSALEHSSQIVKFRPDFLPNSQLKGNEDTLPNFEEYKSCLAKMSLTFNAHDVQDLVLQIQGELNPKKIFRLKKLTEKPKVDSRSSLIPWSSRDWVKLPQSIVDAAKSCVLDDMDGGSIFGAPTNQSISNLEKQMMNLALTNIHKLKEHVRKSVDLDAPCDLDVTRYVHSSPDVVKEKPRKRKMSVEVPGPSKVMKVAEYETPPFDKTLYSQIQRHDKEDDDAVILETQTQVLPEEDDQVAKFEKREEIAELKRKMLAEEKEMETKQPSTSRHSLAPSRLTGRHSPSCEESADKEMVMEIEKMFQSQVKPDALEESVWSSSESDGEGEERLTTPSVDGEDHVEIEFIPDLVKNFHHKLKSAGLLELLCEVFKEGGVLRFTHRLNGVMLGTVLMLQKIVMYQKKEVEPYCSKMATIIREILYARPSPTILLEVNVLLRHAVGIRGFTKMLCHNASQDTFVIKPEKVYFTRGACLLEMVCILVTYATEEDTDLQLYFELSIWVYRIICSQKNHITTLYDQHNANRRRCMCITALNNTMVMVYHRALSLYRSQYETYTVKTHKKKMLSKIFICGLQVLRIMYSYGPFSFLFSIKTQYLEYQQLLVWLKDMHEDEVVYKDFRLTTSDLFIVSELLKDKRNPNPIPKQSSEPLEQPNFSSIFGEDKPWPYDLGNSESLMKSSETSESEED
ncbi:hypothetical protein GE061_008151 [Apolygus lucorum]|uniref:Uncharacterized protein n=1 Tax=Apolygus lucorum TaxID=248454 RepID=A0A6A4J3P8_APOLU|nr:hypothetical protein GE061_008151 [Apolygus lucorum]